VSSLFIDDCGVFLQRELANARQFTPKKKEAEKQKRSTYALMIWRVLLTRSKLSMRSEKREKYILIKQT